MCLFVNRTLLYSKFELLVKMNFSFILEGRGLRFSFLYFIHNRGALFMCCLDGCVLFAQICLRWKIENTWLVFEQWTLSHQTRWGGFLPTSAQTSKCLNFSLSQHRIFSILHVYNSVSFVTELFTVRAHWPRAGSKAAHLPHALLHPDKAWIPDLFSIK